MNRFLQFLLKNVLTNFLAVFLVCLSVADGDDADHEFIHQDVQIAEIDYDFVDFPTSLIRNNTVSFSSLQRIADVSPFTIDFSKKISFPLSDAQLNQISHTLLHPLMSNLVKVVICKNAP
ncbi:MAG: hypothetical protein JJU34_19575 [Lunatimonas sp.]|uniref:hypothetical protein n=1 Tax=Lunatimonas sp. TaxID=2060141 RepID=UPI00263A9F17|nr:hypothetical protein [Lunatimonas sp.]MCC5939488.1 hypothetical protein [Lunatimonas sp.]